MNLNLRYPVQAVAALCVERGVERVLKQPDLPTPGQKKEEEEKGREGGEMVPKRE